MMKKKRRIDFLKNFGFADEVTVVAPGINAKMSEFQATLGLLQLKEIDKYIEERKKITLYYREKLKDVKGIKILNDIEGVRHNYSYFPILVDEKEYELSRDELYEKLKMHNIFGRRYFYPLISHFPTYRSLPSASPDNLTVAEKITKQVICLPIYVDLASSEVEHVVKTIAG